MVFGYNDIGPGNFFDGTVEEIMTYCRTLNSSEIKSIYERNKEMICNTAYVRYKGDTAYVEDNLYVKGDTYLETIFPINPSIGIIIDGNIDITGDLGIAGNLDIAENVIINSFLSFNSGVSVDTILDEDNMVSDDEDALATQQSIKAYVDSQIGGESFWERTRVDRSYILIPKNRDDNLYVNTILPMNPSVGIILDGNVDITGNLSFGDFSAQIWEDNLGNLTFRDDNAGTLTLSDMAKEKIIYIRDEILADNIMVNITDDIWAFNKVIIKAIKITSSSTNWDLYIYCDSSEEGGMFDNIKLVSSANGNRDLLLDLPYIDNNSSTSIHFKFIDMSDAGSPDNYGVISVYAVEART